MKTKQNRTAHRIAWQKEYDRKRYLKNKVSILSKNRKWKKENKESMYQKNKEYYLKNSKSVCKYIKKWGEENEEKVSLYKKKWRENNKQKIKIISQSDRGKYTTYKAAAKKRNYSFRLSFTQFSKLLASPCFLCGEPKAGGIDRLDNRYGYSNKNAKAC